MQRVALQAGNVFSLILKLSITNPVRCPINFVTRASDIALHIDIRQQSRIMIVNSCIGGSWGGQITIPVTGIELDHPFFIELRFSYKMVKIIFPEINWLLLTMPVRSEEISEIQSTAILWETELRRGSTYSPLTSNISGSQIRKEQAGIPIRHRRLTAAAFDCDATTIAALAEFCDEVIKLDVPYAGDERNRMIHARNIAGRLNEIASAAEGNFIAVSRGVDSPDVLQALIADFDLCSRKDPFLLALGRSFALGEPWVLAGPGGIAAPFVSFLDAISPASHVVCSSVYLSTNNRYAPGLPDIRPLRLQVNPLRNTIMRYATGRLAVVLCNQMDAPISVDLASASNDEAVSYRYTLRRATRARTGVEGDCVVVPDLPAYNHLPNVLEAAATYLFQTTDYDAVLFLYSDDSSPPHALSTSTFGRCEWAHLAPDGTPIATFVARRRPGGEGEALLPSVKTGTISVIPTGAGFWDTDRIENGSGPVCEALLKELRSTNVRLAAPIGDTDPHAPMPAICLSAISRLCARAADAAGVKGYKAELSRLSLPELQQFDWKQCVDLMINLGHLVGIEARSRMLEDMLRLEGIPFNVVCERAGQRSLEEREWDDALKWYERWYSQPERPLSAGLGMVKTHLISGNPEKALTVLQEVSNRSGAEETSRPVLEARFHIYEYTGQWDAAMATSMQMLSAGPVDASLLVRAVSCALHTGRYETANDLLSQLRRSGQKVADRLYLEARLFQLQGRLEESARHIDEFISSQPEYSPLNAQPTVFQRLDNLDPDAGPGSVSCIIVARNENLRLPWLIDYYRGLGVGTIMVIDNGSTDGSVGYLLQRGDVHVFQTNDSYAGSRYGVKWHNEIADEYLRDRWILVVDADEALVYPGAETVSLPRLCSYLDAQGYEGLRTVMLDMYPEMPLRELRYEAGQSLVDACPWFDAGPYIRRPFHRAPYWAVRGGVRERFFWRRRHALQSRPPVIQKMPLVKWRLGMKFLSSTHEISPLQVADISGALLHFKFLQDFHRKALIEVHRKEHYNGASEYLAYLGAMDADPGAKLWYPGSQRYSGPADLVRRGLMSTTEVYHHFCTKGATA